MRTVGIICEYNPFHKGHLRQLRLARELAGEDCALICLMSGNYVQRGEPALFPKALRAEAALRCGTCSGRTADKAAEFGIALADAEKIAPQVVRDSRVVFECRLVDAREVSDHVLYIAEIVAIRGDAEKKALFAFDGYGRLDTV